MRVAVIGGTGNISTSVVRRLLEHGHDVTCVNRGLHGTQVEGSRTILGDRHDTAWFVDRMRKECFDAAIDMICFTPSDARASIAAFRDVQHFIQTSTVRTYGRPIWFPVSEEHPLQPDVDYARGKVEADHLFLAAYHGRGFPVTILKPSTTYGPQRVLRQTGLDTSWLDRIKIGRPILNIDGGVALHQFLHVDDAARAYVGVLGKKICLGQTYNLANPRVIDWFSYHETAMSILDSHVDQISTPLRVLERFDANQFAMASGVFSRNCFYATDKLARDIPEFRVEVDLTQGLQQSITYLEGQGLVRPAWSHPWEDELINRLRQSQVV